MVARLSIRGLFAWCSRALRRPRAWLVRYLLGLIPSVIVAALLTSSLGAWLRHPHLSQILTERSLDLLPDLLQDAAANAQFSVLLLVALGAVPLAWITVRLCWLWLEGGALSAYAASTPLGWGAFWRAGWRWFGPFLLLNLVVWIAALGTGAIFAVVAVIMSQLWVPLLWIVGAPGLLSVACLLTWAEVARAFAVAQDQRHIVRALRGGAGVLMRYPLHLCLLVLGALVLYGLLALVGHALSLAIPIRWWLLSLLALQAMEFVRHGVRLARQAGEIGLARAMTGGGHATLPQSAADERAMAEPADQGTGIS